MSTIVGSGLLDKLRERQGGDSDYKFADKLGISHQLWQMTRTGKREIGRTVLEGVVIAYPELYRDVLFFLGADVDSSPYIGDLSTTPSDTAQNRPRAVFRMIADKCYSVFNSLRKLRRKWR